MADLALKSKVFSETLVTKEGGGGGEVILTKDATTMKLSTV